MTGDDLTRRRAIGALGAAGLCLGGAAPAGGLRKSIASSGRLLAAVGMGSWRTFDVAGDAGLVASRVEVLRTFFDLGGELVDSSPMYGTSQDVIGAALKAIGGDPPLFAADKVWTEGLDAGRRQIARTQGRWDVSRLDLLQVHNLVDWRTHLPALFAMKAAGALGHVGVTSYAGLHYDEISGIMESEPIDFIQITYNIFDREAENRLLPLAADNGISVIANRPFREGALFEHFRGKPLPGLAAEIGAVSWAALLLKFAISHPAITAAIPATRRVDHMKENMAAMTGPVPDAAIRAAMIRAIEDL